VVISGVLLATIAAALLFEWRKSYA